MKEEYKYNLINYLNDNKKSTIFLIVIILLINCFGFMSYFITVYNTEKTTGITKCNNSECYIEFYLQGILKNSYNFVKIKDKKYDIDYIEYTEPEIDTSNTILQKVTIKLSKYKGYNNEIVEVSLYKNKEKLIKKIYKIIVER